MHSAGRDQRRDFAGGRSQKENVKAVIDDILGHGNEKCDAAGADRSAGAALSAKAWRPALHRRPKSMRSSDIADEAGVKFDAASLKKVEI